MKRLLLAPLLISFSLLSSGFFLKNANVRKLVCEASGSKNLNLFVNKKTGQVYAFKIDKLFEDKKIIF